MKLFIVLILISSAVFTDAQQYFVRGNVYGNNNEPLSFANIRAANSTLGTSSNKEGKYELRLGKGEYILICSFLGYASDSISIDLKNNLNGINFHLSQINLPFEEIIIKPGENPAVGIIKKAVERKRIRNSKLQSYEFKAFTKGAIKTQEDLTGDDNDLTLKSAEDTVKLKISGILENQSIGFFKRPDKFKEIITARKQTANFPSSINILTGGRLVKSFYEEEIDFFTKPLPGPLSDNSLSYYYFYIEDQMLIDSRKVYQIHISPDNSSDPGFEGRIFITDSTYDLIKIDLHLNRAANIGGIFDTVNIYQQFSMFDDSLFMPVDYMLAVSANYLGLVRFGFELNTILFDYNINIPIDHDFFDKAIVTVLPEADSKDSIYWQNVQTIPNTSEETNAYRRIDSLSKAPKTFWDKFSILSFKIDINKNFSISAPLRMYHFNRVEGHSFDFGLYLSDLFEKRLNASLDLSYGFSDKKTKYDLNLKYLLGDYRTYYLSLNSFNKLKVLSEDYDQLTATVLSLLSKYEFSDYYYSSGFKFEAGGEVFPSLALRGGFENHTDKNAYVSTNYSIFAKDETFRENPEIYQGKVNALTAGFTIDFRDYIEDGFFRRRITQPDSYIIVNGDIIYSDESLLKSELSFTTYMLTINGALRTFKSAGFNFNLIGINNTGQLPYQLLYAIPGNIDVIFKNFTFRTLNVNEIKGEKVVTLNLEHNFNDELFRLAQIPGIMDWEIQFKTFFNISYAEIKKETQEILIQPVKTFPHPFYEIGFGLGHVLIPIEIEFAWKLNYRDGHNFRAGLNVIIL
ncbi:MAG: DUF5686 family protein [Ignavibacteria bacterium]